MRNSHKNRASLHCGHRFAQTDKHHALSREIRHTTPWNAITTTVYSGNSIVVTEPQWVKTSTLLDTLGRVVKRMDATSNATTYAYGPFNTLRSVTAPGNTTTTWARDAFGRVRKLEEPDRGTTDFVNDAFGDVVSSTDALGRTVTWTRDALGRPDTRTDTHLGKTLTTSWTWDTAPNGVGTGMGLKPHAIQSKSAQSADFVGSIRSAIAIHDEGKTMGHEWRSPI